MTDKVAVFLDIENLSGWLKAEGGEILLDRSTELGRVAVRRAYGDFSNQSVSVRQTDLNLLGFEFVHVYHPVKGKNSADIQIVVDVMEYVARIPDLKWFVLATGDSDFSPLFRRLRELGKSVVGVGPRSALSESVKKSCNRFIYIDSSPNSDSVASLKAAQLREDALELLERVLKKFPEGVNLSILKNKMIEVDSGFDESNLGFNGFKKFLQIAPEIVILYQVKSIWHARAADTTAENHKVSINNRSLGDEPTTEMYHRLLRRISWFSCELSFLWDALTKLDRLFPEGFTRSEEFEYLIESFGHNRTRKEIRAAIYVLYKSGFIIYKKFQNQDDESVLFTEPPASERLLAERVDAAMLPRLINACKAHNVPLELKALTPLLLSTYSKEELKKLISNAQEQKESIQ
jgi:hypothetical protein